MYPLILLGLKIFVCKMKGLKQLTSKVLQLHSKLLGIMLASARNIQPSPSQNVVWQHTAARISHVLRMGMHSVDGNPWKISTIKREIQSFQNPCHL